VLEVDFLDPSCVAACRWLVMFTSVDNEMTRGGRFTEVQVPVRGRISS
jgi:hypothetical protein